MSSLQNILAASEAEILAEWLELQDKLLGSGDVAEQADRREHSRNILHSLVHSAQSGNLDDIHTPEWRGALDALNKVNADRAAKGSSALDTATFILSLKQPIFNKIQKGKGSNPEELAAALWSATTLIDKLGLYSIEIFQKTREGLIKRQQQEMMELSTPVVKLFDELIALPLIGTLDSARTQVVMENLLGSIVASNASIAILDITGVPTVDTQVAQHLLKTVAAARLMGADCIISGVRPQIAQTIVHLGVELQNVTTKATMADALKVALQRLGYNMVRRGA